MPLLAPDELRNKFRLMCKQHKIFGRVLIAGEGLNGAVCGTQEAIAKFQQWIKQLPQFSDATFREQDVSRQVYHKLVVRVRSEIVHFGESVDLHYTGKHISPEEFHTLLERKEDVVLLDARNDYEYGVGKFHNAVTLPITAFRDFSKHVSKLEVYKKKKIVMYCTGGIRCEKASAYLKKQGFQDVNQLQGGIIHYINKFPHGHFKGSCFVFDDRLTTEVDGTLTSCKHCGTKTGLMINCYNLDCDKLFICCESCQREMNHACSMQCKSAPRQRKESLQIKHILGKVLNYYARNGIALVQLYGKLQRGDTIHIRGRTTPLFAQPIHELKNDVGEDVEEYVSGLVTFPVNEKIRKNDELLVLLE